MKIAFSKQRLYPAVITAAVLLVILAAGPVTAFAVTNWNVTADPQINDTAEVNVSISKNSNEVIQSIEMLISGPDDNEFNAELVSCDPHYLRTGTGYGYGYLGGGYGYDYFGYGYGYGYGYFHGTRDPMTCSFHFLPTQFGSYFGTLIINGFEVDSNFLFTLTAPEVEEVGGDGGGGAPAGGGGGGATGGGFIAGETPEEGTSSYTYSPTSEELLAVLSGSDVNDEALLSAAAAGTLEVTQTVTVEQVSPGVYVSTFTLTFTNITDGNLFDVSIVVEIPKAVAEDASEIESVEDFLILEADPVIQFTAGEVAPGGNIEFKYLVNKAVSLDVLEDFTVAAVSGGETGGLCEGVTCDDGNPCTIGTCNASNGLCEYSNEVDGTACGDGQVCFSGECVAVPGPAEEPGGPPAPSGGPPAAPGPPTGLLGLGETADAVIGGLVVVLIALAAFFFLRR